MTGLPNLTHLYGIVPAPSGRNHMLALQALWEFFYQGIGQLPATELTIATGIVTPTLGNHFVDTEADAASDDLTTIETTNFVEGRWLYVRAVHTDRTVVLKHGTGNLVMQDATDFSLDDAKKGVMFERVGANWIELWRNSGAGASLVNNQVTNAILRDSAAVSVIGRSANSSGDPADIAAAANDRVLRRVADALDFGQITAGMIPNSILTYAMFASGALATAGEFQAATASKLLSAAAAMAAANLTALTDAATITVDFATGFHFGGASNGPLLLGGDRTLGTPSNVKSQAGFFYFGATGATRALTLHSNYKPITGVAAGPYSITTAQTAIIPYFALSSTEIVYTGVLMRG